MPHDARPGRAGLAATLIAAACAAGAVVAPGLASAQGLFAQPKYAAIVEDANTGEVLYAMRAEALRHPASLTKVMTLYLTFEALSTGRLRMGDVITISPHAYSMMPSKVSTRPGETLTVAEAIPAMTVHSANDVAVAMAERIGGNEQAFARLMTLRAHELGMTETTFVNASGLPPDGEQISSARDMGILARAVMRDYPQYYHFFGLKSFDFHGKTLMNHNHLVAKMPGVDGMKTGYTSLAGFNLVASGVRDGHRLITVVLGGPSVAARDENVEELLDAGFTVLRDRSIGRPMRLASLISSPEDMSGPIARPPVEEGSGDQQNLRVEVEPQLHTPAMAAAAAAVAEDPDAQAQDTPRAEPAAQSDCAPTPRTRRHRRHASVACQTETAKADAAKADPAKTDAAKSDTVKPATSAAKAEVADAGCKPDGRRRRHAACATKAAAPVQTASANPAKPAKADVVATADTPCKPQGRHHHAAACKTETPAPVQTAAASPAVAGDADAACKPHARRRHAAACPTEKAAPVQTADATPSKGETKTAAHDGGYMIQVGAYKSRTLAKGQVDKLGPLVTGSGAVEEGNGNFRARFRGMSREQAAAACHSLSAKGQACEVLSAS